MIEINTSTIEKLTMEAQSSSRKRKNYNFHKSGDDTLQRMLNAFEPGTYVRPHKHENPDKREVFIVLRGIAVILGFDLEGRIITTTILDHQKGIYGIEIPSGVFHTVISLMKGTVLYEVKDGPYTVENDKNFASWAPEEGNADADVYLNQLLEKAGLSDFKIVD